MNVVPFGLPLGANPVPPPFVIPSAPGFALAVDAALGAPTSQSALLVAAASLREGEGSVVTTPGMALPAGTIPPSDVPLPGRPAGTPVAMLIATNAPGRPSSPASAAPMSAPLNIGTTPASLPSDTVESADACAGPIADVPGRAARPATRAPETITLDALPPSIEATPASDPAPLPPKSKLDSGTRSTPDADRATALVPDRPDPDTADPMPTSASGAASVQSGTVSTTAAADPARPAAHPRRGAARSNSSGCGDAVVPDLVPAVMLISQRPVEPIVAPAAAAASPAVAHPVPGTNETTAGTTFVTSAPVGNASAGVTASATPSAADAAARAPKGGTEHERSVAPPSGSDQIAPQVDAIGQAARTALALPSREVAHEARPPAVPATHASEPEIAARAGVLGRTLGVEIGRSIANGEESLRVRLNPQELGRVEVTIAFDGGGSLRATVSAETQRALELLRGDSADLGRALDQAGVRADAQSFRFESRAGSGEGQSNDQRRQDTPRATPAPAATDPTLPEPDYRPIRGDGRIDLLA